MRTTLKLCIYGFFTWLIPFAIGFLIWPLHQTMLPLFKSIMVVSGVLTGVFFIVLFYKKASSKFLKYGILMGIYWLSINIFLDFIVLIGGFKTPLKEYVIETGIRYLMIPIMTIGFGYILNYKCKENG